MNNINLESKSIELIEEIKSKAPQISTIKQLIIDGANVNYQQAENGYTPLMYAVMAGNSALVTLLLENGANPLLKNQECQIASEFVASDTPIYKSLKNYELLFATAANDVVAAREILAQGANVNHQGVGGYSALMIAVEKSYIELVDLLLASHADMDLFNQNGDGVYSLVLDKLIYITLLNGEPLSEKSKNKYYAEQAAPSAEERCEQARLNMLEARKATPFSIEQLKIYNKKTAATEKQINELEKYFGHPIPSALKEIYQHFNGGWPKQNKFGRYDTHDSIRYFYLLNDDKENVNNVWNVIDDLSSLLGPDTIPFAEHSYSSVYYLKWENNQARVYVLIYGDFALEHLDEDELDEFINKKQMPHIIEKTCDSLDEFLAGLYDPN